MQSIDINKHQVIGEIINIGCQRAAAAFTSLTGQQVSAETISVNMAWDYQKVIKKLDETSNLTVLKTDIIGDLTGRSFLIFNEPEHRLISRMSLTAMGNASFEDEHAVLQEIDNILSGTVITEISNLLDINIHGGVPQLLELYDIAQLQAHIGNKPEDYYLIATGKFVFDGHVTISPLFMWTMHRSIMTIMNSQTSQS